MLQTPAAILALGAKVSLRENSLTIFLQDFLEELPFLELPAADIPSI